MNALSSIIEDHPHALSRETMLALLQFMVQRVKLYESDVEELEAALVEMNDECERQRTIIGRLSAEAYAQGTDRLDDLKKFHVTGCVTDLCGGAPEHSIVERLKESSGFDDETCYRIIGLFKKAVNITLLMANEGFEPGE